MLSNPTSSIHARQRQHRRQNSTPSAFEGVKISTLPNANQRQAAGQHRRGISLDIRRQQPQQSSTARQQEYKVRMTTNNTGLASTSQHQVLREAQQQRIQARPGTNQQHHYAAAMAAAQSDSENYLISPHGTPSSQRFDSASCFDTSALQFDPYGAQLNMMLQKNQENYASNMAESKNFDLYSNDSNLSTPTFVNFPGGPAGQWSTPEGASSTSRRNSRRISDGIMERVSRFENMGMEEIQSPATPPNQNGNNYLPPTPMETPHDRMVKQEPRPDRFSDEYDESMEETIKPVRNRMNGRRAQSVFEELRAQSQRAVAVPSPPRSSTIPESKTFSSMQMHGSADYMNMNALRNEFMKMEGQYDSLPYDSDAGHSASDFSHQNSPAAYLPGPFDGKPEMQPADYSDASSMRGSGHRRTESVASAASAASIANINIEETRTDTGVTLEEISQYIRSPETTDGKWTCIFDDCGKKFGRKENIKSHVQTHLNDRQYQCPTCQKCFVRQHDLKRHAKIHTGVKPYPCECGNSFARHDALTRHRQRGMCIGAFDGIVRKVVKRGRPRKNRPDMETRMEKSARTRRKNMSISSMSSQSGYSDSSAPNSPENDFNMLDDVVEMKMNHGQSNQMASYSSAPMPTMVPRTIGSEMASSPAAVSVHSPYVSPEAIMEKEPSHVAVSPAKSTVSHYNTPPELSQSSSPPAAQFFDLDANTSANTDDLAMVSSGNTMLETSGMNGSLSLGMGDHDDDLLLQFSSEDDGLVQLDRDSSMLMMSKFDEEFDNAVGMFTNNDDMFFSSN